MLAGLGGLKCKGLVQVVGHRQVNQVDVVPLQDTAVVVVGVGHPVSPGQFLSLRERHGGHSRDVHVQVCNAAISAGVDVAHKTRSDKTHSNLVRQDLPP